jgi:hypothetical protein
MTILQNYDERMGWPVLFIREMVEEPLPLIDCNYLILLYYFLRCQESGGPLSRGILIAQLYS